MSVHGREGFMASGPSTQRRSNWWLWLLAIPFLALLFPQIYNFTDPTVLGFPFYYWYQLIWVIITAGLLWLVHVKAR